MSSPKLLAYKAVIEHASLLADIIKNPDAIKQAAREYAEGLSLSETKKIEAEKALQTIEYAKKQKDNIEKDKKEFDENVKNTLESLRQERNAVNALRSECEEKDKYADKKLEDAKNLKKTADDLIQSANNKLSDVETKEKSHQKTLSDFASKYQAFEQEKAQYELYKSALIARENKLKEALS